MAVGHPAAMPILPGGSGRNNGTNVLLGVCGALAFSGGRGASARLYFDPAEPMEAPDEGV